VFGHRRCRGTICATWVASDGMLGAGGMGCDAGIGLGAAFGRVPRQDVQALALPKKKLVV
jgi:hypothetical protein